MHMDFCDISYEMSTIQYPSKLSLKILIKPKKKLLENTQIWKQKISYTWQLRNQKKTISDCTGQNQNLGERKIKHFITDCF